LPFLFSLPEYFHFLKGLYITFGISSYAIFAFYLSALSVEFSSEITIPLSFTAERAENAEALENPSVDWNALKLCALGDLRGDKSHGF